jgi:hypothetical protein
MTANTNTGGPAFPALGRYGRSAQLESALQQDGMTLRDYFAAKAMQGFVSDSEWRMSRNPNETAKASYHQADEMIKARGAK